MSVVVHPSAFVSAGASLDDGVVVGPCAVIEDKAEVGAGTRIDAFASVKSYTRIGRNNRIFSYAMLGEIPQDLKFRGEVSRLEIGDGNTIREFATLHRGTEGGGGVTRVGDGCLLMAYTHVAHDCTLGSHIVMSNAATLAGHVEVQDYAIIGGLSAVHQFSRIGRCAFVGGMTGIGQDLPPYMLATGARACLHGPNLVGLRRLNLSQEEIGAVRAVFKIIWLSGAPRREALEKASAEYARFPQAMEIVDFVKASKRGVLSVDRSEAGPDA
ncbi:MAG: acyl-ACP--UDP-N-acetylglucosamine O-acyltransferase [Deltaproteobacteria bacterium]|jgi:UDP-N-acetylglucosamine acyltransferase|nr:acyl-ACP--UDP-N-acetylglucosamine O-acyltransferase [Deltaproteobacteria bacterium]